MSDERVVNELVKLSESVGLEPDDFDDWIYDVSINAATQGSEQEMDLAVKKGSEVNDAGVNDQIAYLLENGYTQATIEQHIGAMGWDEQEGDEVTLQEMVALVREALDEEPVSQFADAQAFGEWLSATLHYDAMDNDVSGEGSIDTQRVLSLYVMLKGHEAGGHMQLAQAPEPVSKAPGM